MLRKPKHNMTRMQNVYCLKKSYWHIFLVKVIDEFKDMKPEQVMAYIEGDPIIGTIPVDPGLTKIIINIVMIGIAKELPKHEEKYELHRLIAALLSNQLNEQQRLAILESEYNIPINTDFGKDVNVMCNLGQGIEDRAIAETTAKNHFKHVSQWLFPCPNCRCC